MSKPEYTDEDMANVGHALMESLPDGYVYNNCPSEIVADLQNEIADLRADAAAMAARIQAGDRTRDDVIEECAIAAQQADRIDAEWVRGSLWDAITKRCADTVRRLKTKPLS
jgi:hypothetical protein